MKKLTKCTDKMIFGVCCGIANSLNIDISLIRLMFVLGAIFTGSLLFWLYLLLAIILPSE
jgi:phage shock protein PspC (stress-responsive transcriptional regulator)